ncbi:WD and tetratricopeptide repeats protein [Xenoophorus captivus]|uniref:WD and tetratricopeptide repeats protein n=1 Tax=Xenoophorus captivus TaxID=1517983 RepID=A0ABV0RPL8_9TELE
MWPNTFWSAAEDGIIRQYDLRENSKHSEVLIDLTEFCGQLAEAKCLAVNPRDNNYLAVGANGPFVRLYDIRMIHNYRYVVTGVLSVLKHMQNVNKCQFCSLPRKSLNQNTSAAVHTFCDRQKPIPDGAGQYYVAGHLPVKLRDYNNRLRVLVATYVTFSPDGTELLVNMGGEQCVAYKGGNLYIAHFVNSCCCCSPVDVPNGKTTNGIHLPPSHIRFVESKTQSRLARCLFELKYVAEALECLDDFKGKFPEQAHSSACDALDKDIKAALYSKPDSEDKKGNSSIRFQSFSRKESIAEDEVVLRERSFDYKHRYCGHCNTTTDIKEANFFGSLTDRSKQFVLFISSKGQYIVSGSDDGSFFIWEKETTNLVRILQGDESIVNCLQPHPSYCFLATSGIDPVVRLWNPRPETDGDNGRVVEDMEGAAQANQRRMNADPLEVMLLNMGYRITGLHGVGPDGSDDEDSSEGPVQCRTS